MDDLFGSLSEENVKRIKRQNERNISVIIGNPPYNANQQNENDNNKNRTYPRIDERIKATSSRRARRRRRSVRHVHALLPLGERPAARRGHRRLHQQPQLHRQPHNGRFSALRGEGFRGSLVVDLGGDVRANPKLSGTKNNVFGIQTGVAISFLVRKKAAEGCRIFYARRPEMETREEKSIF